MNQARAIVDTGPLVALLRANDLNHSICVESIKQLPKPLLTTWAVITEAAWLLRHSAGAIDSLLAMVELKAVKCIRLDSDFAPWCRQMLRQYHDLHPQLADLSLVYIANQHATNTVFTLDRRDFSVLRDQHGQPFNLVPETLSS